MIKCSSCEGGVPKLTTEELKKYLPQVPKWSLIDGTKIEREYVFHDFKGALAFVNACGEIAESEGHHPDLFLHGWNKVKISLYTHAVSGLTLNDFVVAAKIDALK